VAVGAPVTFTDTTTGAPTAWSWDFGDATTSTIQSPSHSWTTAGTYTVSLVASNSGGQSAPASATITVTAAPDTQPPSDPTNFNVTANGSSRIDLTWTAPTDNVGVFGCDIFRNGSPTPLVSVSGTATSYSDTGLAASTPYGYTIQARDAAGNKSNLVGPATATTGAGGTTTTVTLVPTADAYTDASQPAVNYGKSTSLRVDGSPIVRSYLTFNLSGVSGSVTRATLRVYANSALTAGYSVGGTGTAWTETGLTAANAPPIGPSIGGSGAFGAAVWTSVDVTSLVTAGTQVGLGLFGSSATAVNLAARESGANSPQLVLEVGP
jgi:PKD repeat protein